MKLVLHNLRLFDGLQPRLQDGRIVVLQDRAVAAVAELASLPDFADAPKLDLGGRTLLPGLIDAHVQIGVPFIRRATLRALRDLRPQLRNNLRWCLRSGVTAVRDMAGVPGTIQWCRREVDSGRVPGPRILCANSFISCPGGYPDMAPHFNPVQRWLLGGQFAERVATVAQARDCVRRMVDLGADWIKTGHADRSYFAGRPAPLPSLSDECYRAIVEEASRCGRPVGFHHTWLSGFRKGLELGVRSLEHVAYDGEIPEREAGEVARRGIAAVPTLHAPQAYMDMDGAARWLAGHGAEHLAPEPLRQTRQLVELLRSDFHTPEELSSDGLMDIPGMRRYFPTALANVRRLHGAGVEIGCGSDAGGEMVFFGALHLEMGLLVRAGLSRFEALRSATAVNARILGMADRLGTVEAGKLADLIAVRGNPLDDLACLADVHLVIKDGEVEYSGLAET